MVKLIWAAAAMCCFHGFSLGKKKGDVMQLCFCNSPHTAAVCLYFLFGVFEWLKATVELLLLLLLHNACCLFFFFRWQYSGPLKWWKTSVRCDFKTCFDSRVGPPPPPARCAGDLPQTMVIMCHCRGSEPFEEEIRSRASGRPHVHRSLRTWQKAYLWEEASFY